jgi:hypothetical protein
VFAIGISLVLVRDIPNGRVVPPAPPGGVPQHGVPQYYVTLYNPPQHTAQPELLVGDTVTGAKLGVVPPPRGARFVGVTAAADDRTFVVDTERAANVPYDYSLPRTWYLLRIAPGTSSPARLTRLPIPSLTDIYAIALSGSGNELAVAVAKTSHDELLLDELLVYSVPGGKLLRHWSTKDTQIFDPLYFEEESRALAWIDGDRAIAFAASFNARQPNGQYHLEMTWRRLDVAAGGGDLAAESKVIWSLRLPPVALVAWPGCLFNEGITTELISADGETVVCDSVSVAQGTLGKSVAWRVRWLAFSVRTGGARILYQAVVRTTRPPYVFGLWASTSGDTIIGEWGLTNATGYHLSPHVGVISHGTFTPLSPPDASPRGPIVTW